MIRRFKFEDEVHQSLSCVPMAVRRKLDHVGVKISLAQWQGLGEGERLALCHLPVDSAEECRAMRTFLEEAVVNRCGTRAKPLAENMRAAAQPPDTPPPQLVANASAEGVALDQSAWNRLDADERYALIKLGASGEKGHNFVDALHELVK